MAPDQDLKKRVGRKLTKKRKPLRASSVQFPERLKEGDDAQEDVTVTKGLPAQYMNHSVFSLIAKTATGSKVDFNARFPEESSDSEDEPDASTTVPNAEILSNEALPGKSQEQEPEQSFSWERPEGPHEKRAGRSGLGPLPKLDLKTIKEKDSRSQSSRPLSEELPSTQQDPRSSDPCEVPVMSRILEARVALSPSTKPADSTSGQLGDLLELGAKSGPSDLAVGLQEIFGLEIPEEVVKEYPCWLLQSVLLQGYMYITQNHICFFAYLPKKSNTVVKSGHLSKRGKRNPKFHRYWFSLIGDILSYYTDPSDLYFPSGNIDLQYGTSASLVEHKDKGKEVRDFSLVTHQRVYYFKADSSASAQEWVKTLQTVIFRSHNDGDSVKISLPIENVMDVEESPIIEFAETVQILVVDNEDTYAIDEYFFSFFSFGSEAIETIRSMINGTTAKALLSPSLAYDDSHSRDNSQASKSRKPYNLNTGSPLEADSPILRETVRATLVPSSPTGSSRASPPRSGDLGTNNMDVRRRSVDFNGKSSDLGRKSIDLPTRDFSGSSFDRGRRSVSTSRNRLTKRNATHKTPVPVPQGSTDSFVHSLEQDATSSSAPNFSSNETQASGSQILNRSDVFQSPTIQRNPESLVLIKSDERRRSVDSARTHSVLTPLQIRPPTISHTEQSTSNNHRAIEAGESQLAQSNSLPTLHHPTRAGASLQKVAGLAGFLRSRSKKMSNLLATESMGYVEKVSGMWAGGRKHYGSSECVMPDDRMEDLEDVGNPAGHGDRFRAHFALPASEKLQATYFGYLHRVLPLYGKIYIGNRKFCFRSLVPGTNTKMVLPLKDIENVDKENGFHFGWSGLVIVVRGHEELFLEFTQHDVRDDCAVTLHENLQCFRFMQESGVLAQKDKEEAEIAKAENKMLQEARQNGYNEHELKMPKSADDTAHPQDAPPILFDDPRASILNFKPTESLRITCLTIGSRGDVQPYIALCKGLLKEGHRPKIATHAMFESWVRKHGIEFATVEGNPEELMRICVENGMFTLGFLKEASVKFRGWMDQLLTSAWKACQETDILIESPSAMAGIHIAEALAIPYFRAFTMPWTRTRAYPHAFAVPEHKMGGTYNYFSYVMFDHVFWKAMAGQVNRWRKMELGLRSTNLEKMQPNKVPFLYNFSPSVVVPPLDYSDWIRVTGYWFLDEASDWTPPKELTDFIAKARADDKRIVYVGFGSIVVSDPAALTKTVVDAVLKSDVRCILSKGWSDRLGNKDAAVVEMPLPLEIQQIKSAPHDWLFTQIDAAVHHGGAGTTGASLRAGLPTVIKPFFGDQFFFGTRIEDLGVGICIRKVNVSVLSRALWEATHSQRMISKARVLGEQIRKEDGVGDAIKAIYRDLEYAKSLIKHRNNNPNGDNSGGIDEESWTFIGDESDPEATRRIAAWDPAAHVHSRKSFEVAGRQNLDLGA